MSPVNNELIRVACYIRVSHQEQKLHGISLDAQRDKLKEHAEKHGLKIVDWYEDEGISGRKLIKNRPALQRMLNDAQAGKFDRIIFIKLDRFFRSVAEYHECMKKIDPVLWTATEEKYDLTTANGRAFVNMKLTIAELEADQTGERIDLVNEYKVKTGQALTGAHRQGMAYTVQKDSNGLKRVVPDPATKDMCMDFINHFLTYQNKQQAYLFVKNKYDADISYNSMTKILTDPKICGTYRGNDSYCEPYVSMDTFVKIQQLIKNNIKRPKSRRLYIFTGLIKCPLCGRKLCSTYAAHKTKTGLREYLSYRCNGNARDKSCTYTKQSNEAKIEAALLNTLDQYVNVHIESVKIENTKEVDKHLEDKIKRVKSEMTKVKRMYRKEDITEAEYDDDMAELKEELRELESKLAPVDERDLVVYEELLKSDWKELYNALSRENKRAFWRKYVKEIVVDENGVFKKPIFF